MGALPTIYAAAGDNITGDQILWTGWDSREQGIPERSPFEQIGEECCARGKIVANLGRFARREF